MNNAVYFHNIKLSGLTREDIFNDFTKFKHVITVNAEFIVEAQKKDQLFNIINSNVATIDGQVPFLILKLKYLFNPVIFKKISGSDLIYDILNIANKECLSVFLLGGNEKSNRMSILKIKRTYPKLRVDGFSPCYQPYPFDKTHNDSIIKEISIFKPDILLVGFGAKKQELWIDDNRTFLISNNVKLAIGVGGTFEMYAGLIKRAPLVIQKLCLEGVYRLIVEPKYFRFKRLIKSFKILFYIR